MPCPPVVAVVAVAAADVGGSIGHDFLFFWSNNQFKKKGRALALVLQEKDPRCLLIEYINQVAISCRLKMQTTSEQYS